MYDAVRGGRLNEAAEMQARVIELLDVLMAAEFPEGFRAAVEIRGFRTGKGRQPTGAQPIDPARVRSAIRAVLRD
jgi:4-hydroxy-tetrahydrodipicolinate synthase